MKKLTMWLITETVALSFLLDEHLLGSLSPADKANVVVTVIRRLMNLDNPVPSVALRLKAVFKYFLLPIYHLFQFQK